MYDIIIIGSGPAGLAAAVYAVRAGKNVLVIEKDHEGTGQIASGSRVVNYLGFADISGYELGQKFREHALSLGVEIKTARAVGIEKKIINDNGDYEFEVLVRVRKKEEIYTGGALVYCAGASHRKLSACGEEEFSGRGVSYCATCDGSFYKDRPVVVVGGGDTALDDAMYLSSIASKVTIVHRRDFFRGAASTLEKLKAKDNVNIITGVNVSKITGKEHVSEIELDNGEVIAADAIFIAVGIVPQTQLLELSDSIDIELDKDGYIKAGEDGRTNVPGVYAAGDVRGKHLRQVITAVADGANVINSIVNG